MVDPGLGRAAGGQGLIPAGLALLLRALVNRLVASPEWASIAPPALGIAGLWIAGQLLSSTLSWVRAVQAERVQDEVHRLIHVQALRLDLAFYDHPESYDQLHRARVDAISQPLALLESLGSLVQNGLGFLVLAGILWTYAGWLPLLLVSTAIPGLLLVARHILNEHRWNLEHTSQERRARYLDWLITERSAAAELRLFDLGTYHRKAFEKLRESLREGRLRLVRQGAVTELGAGVWPGRAAWPAWAGCCTGRSPERPAWGTCCSASRPSSNARFCCALFSKARAKSIEACSSWRTWMTSWD